MLFPEGSVFKVFLKGKHKHVPVEAYRQVYVNDE